MSAGSENRFPDISLSSFEPVDDSPSCLMSPTSPDQQPAQSPTPVPRPRKGTMKDNERLKAELAGKNTEIEELQRQVSLLKESEGGREKDKREKQLLEEKITELEESLSMMSLKPAKKSDVFLIKKLEKAMKEKSTFQQEVKRLEAENEQLKSEATKVSEKQLTAAEEEKKRLALELEQTRHELEERLSMRVNEMEAEKRDMKARYDMEVAQLSQKCSYFEETIIPQLKQTHSEQLLESERQAHSERTNMEDKLKIAQDNLTAVRNQLEEIQSELTEKSEYVEELSLKNHQLQEALSSSRDVNEEALAGVREELQRAKTTLQEVQSELEAKNQEIQKLQRHLSEELEEKNKIRTEMIDLESTCGDFQKEAESALTDFGEASDKLRRTELERDKHRQQAHNYLRELTARNKTVEELEAKLRQLGTLETERTIMSHQLKAFEEDYLSERRSREDLVKKCTILREKNQQLEQEKKALHTQLNELASQNAALQSAAEYEHSADPDDPSGVAHPAYQPPYQPPQWSQ